jgi:hypothetical protein
MQTPAERIQVMEQSLRCFAFGILALVPGVGAAFSLLSLALFFKTRTRAADEWNPAGHYLNWGFSLAVWSLVMSLLLLGWGIVACSLWGNYQLD